MAPAQTAISSPTVETDAPAPRRAEAGPASRGRKRARPTEDGVATGQPAQKSKRPGMKPGYKYDNYERKKRCNDCRELIVECAFDGKHPKTAPLPSMPPPPMRPGDSYLKPLKLD